LNSSPVSELQTFLSTRLGPAAGDANNPKSLVSILQGEHFDEESLRAMFEEFDEANRTLLDLGVARGPIFKLKAIFDGEKKRTASAALMSPQGTNQTATTTTAHISVSSTPANDAQSSDATPAKSKKAKSDVCIAWVDGHWSLTSAGLAEFVGLTSEKAANRLVDLFRTIITNVLMSFWAHLGALPLTTPMPEAVAHRLRAIAVVAKIPILLELANTGACSVLPCITAKDIAKAIQKAVDNLRNAYFQFVHNGKNPKIVDVCNAKASSKATTAVEELLKGDVFVPPTDDMPLELAAAIAPKKLAYVGYLFLQSGAAALLGDNKVLMRFVDNSNQRRAAVVAGIHESLVIVNPTVSVGSPLDQGLCDLGVEVVGRAFVTTAHPARLRVGFSVTMQYAASYDTQGSPHLNLAAQHIRAFDRVFVDGSAALDAFKNGQRELDQARKCPFLQRSRSSRASDVGAVAAVPVVDDSGVDAAAAFAMFDEAEADGVATQDDNDDE